MICAKTNMVRCCGIITPGCRKKFNKEKIKSPHCPRCKNIKWKQQNPYSYALVRLRGRAKERGHECTLTLPEFKKFCIDNDLLANRGREALCLSIDRIRSHEGYHIDNIQVLTVSANSQKENRARYGAWNQ